MPAYRYDLPQLTDPAFLTDGGTETTLIYDDGCGTNHRHIDAIATACLAGVSS